MKDRILEKESGLFFDYKKNLKTDLRRLARQSSNDALIDLSNKPHTFVGYNDPNFFEAKTTPAKKRKASKNRL